MSGIARILLARGVAVSGSDAKDSRAVLALRALGARVEVGHDAAHLPSDATVVVSTAIRETNPELAAARERGSAGGAPCPGARRADRRAPRRRRGGHPRQDLDHVDAHRRAAALRARPVVRHRRRPDHDGGRGAPRRGRRVRRRGRRERRLVHRLHPGRRGDHQRRARPPRPPRHRAGLPRGVRRLRRPDPAGRHPDRLHRRPRRRAARRPGARPGAHRPPLRARRAGRRRPARVHPVRRGRPPAGPAGRRGAGAAARGARRAHGPERAGRGAGRRRAGRAPRLPRRGAGRRSTAYGGGSSTGAG